MAAVVIGVALVVVALLVYLVVLKPKGGSKPAPVAAK